VDMYKRTEEYYVINCCTVNNTPCTKMTGAVSGSNNSLGNAHRSMSLSQSVTLHKENGDSRAESVLRAAVCE
jgi:hypothetical protein